MTSHFMFSSSSAAWMRRGGRRTVENDGCPLFSDGPSSVPRKCGVEGQGLLGYCRSAQARGPVTGVSFLSTAITGELCSHFKEHPHFVLLPFDGTFAPSLTAVFTSRPVSILSPSPQFARIFDRLSIGYFPNMHSRLFQSSCRKTGTPGNRAL